MDNKQLSNSIKLNGETVFFHHLSQDKEKLELYKKAISEGKITNFDQTTLTRLRKLYYAFYSGLIYMYYEPTHFHNIGNKVELLTHVIEDKEYQIVHGNTDSTRNIPFFMYGVEHLDFNSWIEVEEGWKTWVYDLFSMLKMEKDIYYKLENPKINRVVPKSVIMKHPGRGDYTEFHDGFIEILFAQMPIIEKDMQNHPFKEILSPELTRFKKDINYDDLLLRLKEERINITK